MDEKNETPLNPTSDVEIEPLTDEALESVAGGTLVNPGFEDGSSNSCCSCSSCS
jgi:hypothetical protein